MGVGVGYGVGVGEGLDHAPDSATLARVKAIRQAKIFTADPKCYQTRFDFTILGLTIPRYNTRPNVTAFAAKNRNNKEKKEQLCHLNHALFRV